MTTASPKAPVDLILFITDKCLDCLFKNMLGILNKSWDHSRHALNAVVGLVFSKHQTLETPHKDCI
jgi:hypothetical protein